MTGVFVIGGFIALALVIVGALALIAPNLIADGYGLPADGDAARGFVRATGIRDVVIGLILAAAIYLRDMPLLVVVAIAGVVLSLTDLVIAYHAGGRRLGRPHAVHFSGAVAFVLVLAMALLAIGR
jgi:hypothetical protein